MIKSIVKGTSLLVTGVAVGGLLTYNSRIIEIKAGVDDIKTSAITSIGESKTLQKDIEELKVKYQDALNTIENQQEKIEKMQTSTDANKSQLEEQIRLANKEQEETLEYINNAKTEIENAKK